MNLGLKNKNAVVLASTKGLGKAIAEMLLKESCNIAICSRSEESVNKTLKEFKKANSTAKVIGKNCDVSNKDDIELFFDFVEGEFKNIDILITNAGGPPSGKFEEFNDENWNSAFEQNLMSVVRSVRRVAPGMKKRKYGKIIAITSAAVKAPVDNLMLSNSIRAGVTGFMKTLSTEFAPYNISINTVCPGYIFTDRVQNLMSQESKRSGIPKEEIYEIWKKKIPMGRMGTPEEFASMVVYMCSNNAGYITGSTFWMDGGRYPGLL